MGTIERRRTYQINRTIAAVMGNVALNPERNKIKPYKSAAWRNYTAAISPTTLEFLAVPTTPASPVFSIHSHFYLFHTVPTDSPLPHHL